MPSLYAFTLLLSFFICLAVGCFVYFSSSRKSIHTTFLILCLCNAYLAFSEFMMNQAADTQTAMFWLKVNVFWVIVVAAALHFVLVYTGRGAIFRRWWVWLAIYGPILIFPLISLFLDSKSSSANLKKQSWGYFSVINPANSYGVLFVLLVVAFGYASSIIAIVYFFRVKNPVLKKQAGYVAMGYIAPSVLSTVSGALPAMTGATLPDVTAIGAALQEIIVGLAIWRFNLFELNPVTAANNIIATMSDMLIITDEHGCVASINNAVTRNLGYMEAELLRQPIKTVLQAEDSDAVLKNAHPGRAARPAGISEAISVGSFNGRLIAGNGRTIPAGIVVSRLLKRSGQIGGYVVIARDMTDWKRAEEEKSILIAQLQEALASIKSLKGMIPICSSCKKVRNDEGYWQMVEEYISEHSEADFSHGICDDCLRKLYPDLVDICEQDS